MQPIFYAIAGDRSLGGPMLGAAMWKDRQVLFPLSVHDIDELGGRAMAHILEQLVQEMAVYGAHDALLVGDPIPGLKRPRQRVDSYRLEKQTVRDLAYNHLQDQLDILDSIHPQYEISRNGITNVDLFFRKVIEYGYNELIHRLNPLQTLPQWMYLHQEQMADSHLVLPAWWRRLFKDTGIVTARDICTEKIKQQRKNYKRRHRPKRRL